MRQLPRFPLFAPQHVQRWLDHHAQLAPPPVAVAKEGPAPAMADLEIHISSHIFESNCCIGKKGWQKWMDSYDGPLQGEFSEPYIPCQVQILSDM